MGSKYAKLILGPMRIPFLILNPVCVILGAATASWSGYELNYYYLALALVGAISIHISVNALNEYYDFTSGLDLNTKPTPFSGGSGTLPQNPDKPHFALITGLISLGVTILIGIYFLLVWGLWLLPLGLFGIIIVIAYTNWVTKNPVLCLIAPGMGFGILMVMGTDFVLTGTYSWTSFLASLVPFFLVSDLLLLNQFPDVEADQAVGRRHFPIVIGRHASVWIYGIFLAGAFSSVIVGYLCGFFPAEAFIALAAVFIAVPTVMGVARNADDIPKLIPYMGRNVIINILTPLLLAVGLFIGQ
ncbi:MAG: prenyltransferase [Spirochaetota bacterium]|nr:prenyltransferase [Spirochaetota bacterium]